MDLADDQVAERAVNIDSGAEVARRGRVQVLVLLALPVVCRWRPGRDRRIAHLAPNPDNFRLI